jgi:hypothetical protein
MASKEIVLRAAAGTRLIEVRHQMPRGLSVSRYRLATPGKAIASEFTTLRKARAAFRAQVAEARSCFPAGTDDA